MLVVRLHECDTKCDAELTMIGEKESASCRFASTGPVFTWETEENREPHWRPLTHWSGLELCTSWPLHQTVRFISDTVSGQAGWWVNNEF